MGKKNQSKKHKFKHAEPRVLAGVSEDTQPQVAKPAAATKPAVVGAVSLPDYGYVVRDLRRLTVLAAVLVLFELGLWYLLDHTGLGETLYSLIQI